MANLDKGIILSHLTSILQRCKGYADTKVGELASAVQEIMGDVQSSLTSLENGKADKDGAALTGTPTAPTAAEGNNSTQIATTAFVQNAIENSVKINATDDGNGNISLSTQLRVFTDDGDGNITIS